MLDPETRRAWIAWKLKGYSYARIARLVNKTPGAVQLALRPPKAVRAHVIRRANGKCELCRRAIARGELHHRADRPRTVETYDAPNSLLWLCRRCHGAQHVWRFTKHRLNEQPITRPRVPRTPDQVPTLIDGATVVSVGRPVVVAGLTWYLLCPVFAHDKRQWEYCLETDALIPFNPKGGPHV